jgi:hypothetical protein
MNPTPQGFFCDNGGQGKTCLAVTKQFADSDACGILEDDIILEEKLLHIMCEVDKESDGI